MSADVTEIEQLLYRYCFAVDEGRTDDIAAMFAEDAVLMAIYAGDPPVKGRPAIRDWYARYKETVNAGAKFLRHVVSTPAIEVDGDRATAKCYLTADSVSKASGNATWSAGRYEDKLVKQGGRWLFSERQIHVLYATQNKPLG